MITVINIEQNSRDLLIVVLVLALEVFEYAKLENRQLCSDSFT